MATTATLNGIPVLLSGGASWGSTAGTSPYSAFFDVAAGDLNNITQAASQPNTATLELAGRTWEKLSVLWGEPGSNTNKARIRVVDRRFWWDRKHYYRAVNQPRRIGAERRGGAGWGASLESVNALEAFAPKLTYFDHSLQDGGGVWTAKDLLLDVMRTIDPTAPVVLEDEDLWESIDLQGLMMDDDGAASVGKVLGSLGGVDVTVDSQGRVIFFSWLSKRDRSWIGRGDSTDSYGDCGPPAWNKGAIETVDFTNLRPRYIDFLFVPEIEVRHDFVSDTQESGSTDGTAAPRLIDNVAASPDLETTLASGEKLTVGEYAKITDLLTAWGGRGLISSALSLANLRRVMIPRNAGILHRALSTLEAKDPDVATTNWGARIQALLDGYRQLYRLPRRWTDNALAIKPYLVGTWSVTSGQRARAVCYADHTVFPTAQGRWALGKSAEKMPWCLEVDSSYPGQTTDPTTDNPVAPFVVSIEDEDQGIIRLSPVVDRYSGTQQSIVPGLMENLPSGATRSSNTGGVFLNSPAAGVKATSLVSLSSSQRVAVFLTMIPARALYRVRIHAHELGMTASGPPMEVRITEETARIAWSQRDANLIERAFGLANGSTREDQQEALAALEQACVNHKQSAQGAAGLVAMARSSAREVFSQMANRLMGSRTVDMRGMGGLLRPVGNIASVTHSVGADGKALSSIALRGNRPKRSILGLLGSGARSVLLRLVRSK